MLKRTNKHKIRKPPVECVSLIPMDLVGDARVKYALDLMMATPDCSPNEDFTKAILNCKIKRDELSIDDAMKHLQYRNYVCGKKSHAVVCAMCANRIGMKRCSGCPKTSMIRYCSRECQVMAWPSHKAVCGQCDLSDI